jgi:hypothetical protein
MRWNLKLTRPSDAEVYKARNFISLTCLHGVMPRHRSTFRCIKKLASSICPLQTRNVQLSYAKPLILGSMTWSWYLCVQRGLKVDILLMILQSFGPFVGFLSLKNAALKRLISNFIIISWLFI